MAPDLRRKFYKWIYLGALMFVAVILQTTVLSRLRFLGCSPSLIPFIVATVALLEGHEEGMIAGLIGGFLGDALYSGYEGFFIIALPVIALLICVMNTVMFWKNYGMSVLDWAVLMILLNTAHYLLFMLAKGQVSAAALLYVIPGELATTLPFTPFLYMIIKKIIKSFERSEDY